MSAESYSDTMTTDAETTAHVDRQQFWRRWVSATARATAEFVLLILPALFLLGSLLPDDQTVHLLAVSAIVVVWWVLRRRRREAFAAGRLF